MYRKMVSWIRRAAPTVKIYLCMESREVWEQVFGYAPVLRKRAGQPNGAVELNRDSMHKQR